METLYPCHLTGWFGLEDGHGVYNVHKLLWGGGDSKAVKGCRAMVVVAQDDPV